ncbi:hypothetical protein ACOMHN_029072 [Nucella lapillus]
MSLNKVYGVLLSSVRENVIKDTNAEEGAHPKKGQEIWAQMLQKAGINSSIDFVTHKKYPLDYMPSLARAHSQIQKITYEESMYYFGQCFVRFCQASGHALMLQVAGREYRDFLVGIDNLHETMRFAYPKMRSPYFLVEQEDEEGCVMIYQSQRYGFAHYVIGQLEECAVQLYKVKAKARILEEVNLPDNKGCSVKYRLNFDNLTYRRDKVRAQKSSEQQLPDVDGNSLFKLLPFSIAFDKDLVIKHVGKGVKKLLGKRCRPGMVVSSIFKLRRPLIEFNWETILRMRNVAFELEVAVNIDDMDDDTPRKEDPSPAQAAGPGPGWTSSDPTSSAPSRSEDLSPRHNGSVQSSSTHPEPGHAACPHSTSGGSTSADSASGRKSHAPGNLRSAQKSRTTGNSAQKSRTAGNSGQRSSTARNLRSAQKSRTAGHSSSAQKSRTAGHSSSAKKAAAQNGTVGQRDPPEGSSAVSEHGTSAQRGSTPGPANGAIFSAGQNGAPEHNGSCTHVISSDQADPELSHPIISVKSSEPEPNHPESAAQTSPEHPNARPSGSAQSRNSYSVYGGIGASEDSGAFVEVESPERHEHGDHQTSGHKRSGKYGSRVTDDHTRAGSPGVSVASGWLCPFAQCMPAAALGGGAHHSDADFSQMNPDEATVAAKKEGIQHCPFMDLASPTTYAKSDRFKDYSLTVSPNKDPKPSEMSENGTRNGGESVTIKVTDTSSTNGLEDSSEEQKNAHRAAVFENGVTPSHAQESRNGRDTMAPIRQKESREQDGGKKREEGGARKKDAGDRSTALLKGQMKYIRDWDLLVYLFTPHISNIDELKKLRMYLSDLNMFDSSMSMVLNGHLSAPCLMHVIEKEKETSSKIQDNYQLQSGELAIRDKFLRNMLPGKIVNKVLHQEDTCEGFEMVTILFSNVVGFDNIVNNVNAHAVVQLLNFSLSIFDPLVDKHRLFKRMAALALEFLSVCPQVKCPIKKTPLTIRIGIHVGNVVTGTIGTLKRQYCLFGDAVNTAARIHTSSMAGRIHLSEPCHKELQQSDFVIVYRGVMSLKGKGETRTYWLAGRKDDPSTKVKAQRYMEEQLQHKASVTSKEDTAGPGADNQAGTDHSTAAKGLKDKGAKSHREGQGGTRERGTVL